MATLEIHLRYGQVIDGVTLVPKPAGGFDHISNTAIFFRRGDTMMVQSRSQASFLADFTIEGVWNPKDHKNCQSCGGRGFVRVEGSDFNQNQSCFSCYNGVPNSIIQSYRITVTE